MSSSSLDIHLKQEKIVNISSDIYDQFWEDFKVVTIKAYKDYAPIIIHGTLCNSIEKGDKEKDYISIPIEAQDDHDGGNIKVYGWRNIL